jgi:glycosyltransferase involved in cell wall biosynthesis
MAWLANGGPVVTATPLVSIVVPTLNGQRYVGSALASLQGQSHTNIEIIVIDSGSSDDTTDIVEDLASKDERITMYRGSFRSIATSRNEGLRRASGPLVSFLDHDDLCPDGKIARQVAHFATGSEASALFGKTIIFASDETDAAIAATIGQLPTFTMCLSAAIFRRSAFDRIGFFNPKFSLADDLDFILRLIEAGLIVSVEEDVATLHRRHPAQATADLTATRREATLALAESLKRRRAAGNFLGMRHPLLTSTPQ